jgi:hypothetical protein
MRHAFTRSDSQASYLEQQQASNLIRFGMEFLKIVAFSTLAAIAYGILHDQVTAHVCVEYFSVAHPDIFHTRSPFLLALGWGIVATWWVGLPLGFFAALAARAGSPPRLALVDLRPAILWLLAGMAICATLAGLYGAYGTVHGWLRPPSEWYVVIPKSKWVAFTADAYAHLASYASGVLGGIGVIVYIPIVRLRRTSASAST